MDRIWTHDPMTSCGLVVVFPDEQATLWDGKVNGLVGEVEERFDGPFVTFALLNGRQPSLVDAADGPSIRWPSRCGYRRLALAAKSVAVST